MADERGEARRTTRQLALVLAAVQASGTEHPTAERVFARVRRDLPRISLGTVYRNLQRLVSDGRIGALAHLRDRSLRYDPTAPAHDHFVCEACGHIDDLPAGTPPGGLAAAEHAGHAVTSHALVLYGCCRTCRARA